MKAFVVAVGVAASLTIGAADVSAQGGYRPPGCELNTGHFLVNSGVVYIKGASEETYQSKRQRMLEDAKRNLLNAIDRGQGDNPAVWYFLGRYYIMIDDAFGADTTFARAERLAPECAEDIAFWRQQLWIPVINQAIDSLRVGAYPGAKTLLRQANALYEGDNIGFYYLAQIYGNEGELDSAITYYKKVLEIEPSDSIRQENYETAIYNIGLLYSLQQHWDSAGAWYGRYRESHPDDPQALLGVARAASEAGDTTRALALYDTVLARVPEMEAADLFRVGEALFRAERFRRAAEAYSQGLTKNPYYRPALYNLVNMYLAVANGAEEASAEHKSAAQKMEAAARRLIAVDPHSVESQRLLAAAFQLQQKDDSTLAALERVEQMTFDVEVDVAQRTNGAFTVQGRITNLKDSEIEVPTLTFEFLDNEGNVLATDTVAGEMLGAEESMAFELTAPDENVVAYQYRVGGA